MITWPRECSREVRYEKSPVRDTGWETYNTRVIFYSMDLTNKAVKATPAFSLHTFAPGWGASVMGTGVISVVFTSMAVAGFLPGFSNAMALVFFWITVVVAIPVLGVTTARWIVAPRKVLDDLHHPVKGAMMATFPGGILVLGIAVGRAGQSIFGFEAARVIAMILAVIGGVLALVVGFIFITRFLSRGDMKHPMITGAWFIPPVVTVLVPPALVPFMQDPTAGQRELLWLSWILLGFGAFLYLSITTVLFYRSLTFPPPPAQLAPTLIIGAGPAGVISLDISLLTQASVRLEAAPESIVALSSPVGLMFWGFGLWWLLAAVIMLYRSYDKLHFALSWWAFSFPLGAWVVAGITLAGITASSIIAVIALVGVPILLALWIVVVVGTTKGLVDGSIWAD